MYRKILNAERLDVRVESGTHQYRSSRMLLHCFHQYDSRSDTRTLVRRRVYTKIE